MSMMSTAVVTANGSPPPPLMIMTFWVLGGREEDTRALPAQSRIAQPGQGVHGRGGEVDDLRPRSAAQRSPGVHDAAVGEQEQVRVERPVRGGEPDRGEPGPRGEDL